MAEAIIRPTTVISVRGRDRGKLLSDPDFVYVGPPVFRGPVNWRGSAWNNPFRVGMRRARAVEILGRDVDSEPRAGRLDLSLCLAFFRAYLTSSPDLMARLPELRSKCLGCWCGAWEPGQPDIGCHAVVIARLADSLPAEGEARP